MASNSVDVLGNAAHLSEGCEILQVVGVEQYVPMDMFLGKYPIEK